MSAPQTNGATGIAPSQGGGIAGLDRHVLTLAIVVVIGAVMSIIDTTIVNVAIETIGRELKSPLDDVQWISSGYLLSLALVIPLTGWASERFGARRVWMGSVGLFVLGSMLCGLAWSTGSLIGFRVLQGFGGGMIMPVGLIILAQAAGPERMGRVMSVIGVPMLLGPVLGPVLGGLILEHLSWRWIFYVNLPVGMLGLALAWRLLLRTPIQRGEKLDLLGMALLSPGVASLIFGLSEVSSHGGIGHPVAWGPIAGGIALIVAFTLHSFRTDDPLIDLSLFRKVDFSAAAATTFALGAALFGALLVLPLYYQVARGETVLATGLLLAPQGLGAALAMPLAGSLTDRIGGGRVALFGIAVMTAATVPFLFVTPHSSLWLLEGSLVFRGIGLASTMMPAMAAAYAALDHAAVPRATSALNVIQRVGGALGTALLAVVLQTRLSDIGAGGDLGGGGTGGPIPPDVLEKIADAFGHTFGWALWLTIAAGIPTLILAWKGKVPSRQRTATEPIAATAGAAAGSTPPISAAAADESGDGRALAADGARRTGPRSGNGRPADAGDAGATDGDGAAPSLERLRD